MDSFQVLSFTIVAMLLVLSPGPNGVLIAKTVPLSGKSAGFANIAGFVAAFYVHGSLSILGISILLVQSSQAFFIFKLLGAAYLFWIGVKSCWQAWKFKPIQQNYDPAIKKASILGSFFEGFLTNALNPKVSMFYLAAFPQFIPANMEASSAFVLVFIHSLLNLLWFSAMVFLLSRIKTLSQSDSFSRCLKSFTGAMFIGFSIKLFFLKPLNN